jgi:hypothetical protein
MAGRGGGGMGRGGGHHHGPGDGAAAPAQGMPLGETSFFLRPEHQRVLRRIFKTPFTGPIDDIGPVSDGGQGSPPIRHIYNFNIPRSAFAVNPTSFRDLVVNNLSNTAARHHRDILLLFSAIVSDDAMGSQVGLDNNVDPNADFMDADILGAPDNNNNNNNGANGNGGAGRGRGRGNGGGNGAGGFNNANNRVDRRGEIQNDGRGLMFTWGQRSFPKVIPCVEELRNPARRPVAYRFWFFVFDPAFDINKGFTTQLQRNHELYQGNHMPENIYLAHASIQTVNDFIERIALPYLQQGLDNDFVPLMMRDTVNNVIKQLCDNEAMRALNLPLSNVRHPAHPATIFGKKIGFSLYLEGVCLEQRDPSNYFSVSATTVQLESQLGEEGGENYDGLNADADGGPDDPDLVVGNNVVEYEEGFDGGDVGDAENQALRSALGMPDVDEASNPASSDEVVEMQPADDGVNSLFGANTGGESQPVPDDLDFASIMNRVNTEMSKLESATLPTVEQSKQEVEANDGEEDVHDVARIANNVQALRGVTDDKFKGFHIPELVCRISSNQFGRMLLNTPLLERIRALSAQGADMLGSRFEEADIFEGLAEGEREDDDDFFFTNDVAPSVLLQRRRQELKNALKTLGHDHRIVVADTDVTNPRDFKDKLMEIRAQANLRKQIARDANAQKEVMEMLRHASGITFQNAVAGEDDVGIAYGGFLPETLSQRLSLAEFQAFAAKHIFLNLRAKNLRAKARIRNSHKEGPELEEALNKFRLKAAAEFWDVFLTSMKLSPSLIEVRNWFKQQAPSEQWGEHIDLMQNLSSFGNCILTILSRYNGIFRGSTNQQAFMLTTLCHYGTFEYDWGIKENLLLMGKGAAGKSYVFETVEILTCPGTMSSWSHTTDKAYSTSTPFSDQTVCMHEAPLSYIGTDKYGKSTLADPVLKDRLAKQRSGTRYFTKDEQGTRITKDEQTMVMGNIIMATNEGIPPEDSPLMQRFIIMALNEMKRPDFNIGDSSQPLKDLVSTTDNKRHIQFAHLLSFYVLILNKMIMCGIIEEPSTDASEILVKDILATFTKNTRISTSHPRKRKMIMDVTRILCYIYSVHMGMFSLFADEHCRDHDADEMRSRRSKNDANGESQQPRYGVYKAFTPDVLVKTALPRLYVTDEMVVYAMTLMSFMFESEHRFVILDTIVSSLNPGVQTGEPFQLNRAHFRIMPNPDLVGINSADHWRRRQRRQNNNNYYQQQNNNNNNNNANGTGKFGNTPQKNGTAAAPENSMQQQPREDDDDEEEEDPAFILDARYACITAENLTTCYNNVVHNIEQNTPSVIEVVRTIKDMADVRFSAHPARLVRISPSTKRIQASGMDSDLMNIEESSIGAQPAGRLYMDENAQDGFRSSASVDESSNAGGESFFAMTSRLALDYATKSSTSGKKSKTTAAAAANNNSTLKTAARHMHHDAMRQFVSLPLTDERNKSATAASSPSSRAHPSEDSMDVRIANATHNVPSSPQKKNKKDKKGYMTVDMKNRYRNDMYCWELDDGEDSVTTSEPVVITCKDPTDQRGNRIMVCVLIEYIKKAPRGDAMLEAIKSVLSTNIMPAGGRTYLTGLPYVYRRTEDVKPEIMPQFCRTLTVPYSNKPFFHRYVRIGTRDSQGFLRSTIRFGNSDDQASTVATHLATTQGLVMDKNTDFNEYCVKRHFHRIGFVQGQSAVHMPAVLYLPAVESNHLRKMTDKLANLENSNVELTAVYPEDCVKEQLTLRKMDRMDITEENDYTKTYFESSGKLVDKLHAFGAGEEGIFDEDTQRPRTGKDITTIPLSESSKIIHDMYKIRRNFSASNKLLHNSLGQAQAQRVKTLKKRKVDLMAYADSLPDDHDDNAARKKKKDEASASNSQSKKRKRTEDADADDASLDPYASAADSNLEYSGYNTYDDAMMVDSDEKRESGNSLDSATQLVNFSNTLRIMGIDVNNDPLVDSGKTIAVTRHIDKKRRVGSTEDNATKRQRQKESEAANLHLRNLMQPGSIY